LPALVSAAVHPGHLHPNPLRRRPAAGPDPRPGGCPFLCPDAPPSPLGPDGPLFLPAAAWNCPLSPTCTCTPSSTPPAPPPPRAPAAAPHAAGACLAVLAHPPPGLRAGVQPPAPRV